MLFYRRSPLGMLGALAGMAIPFTIAWQLTSTDKVLVAESTARGMLVDVTTKELRGKFSSGADISIGLVEVPGGDRVRLFLPQPPPAVGFEIALRERVYDNGEREYAYLREY